MKAGGVGRAGIIPAGVHPEPPQPRLLQSLLRLPIAMVQVRARIDRESAAANTAARFRATQLARRAFGGEHG